ncbi:YccF domain-containing protein [Aerophototrophica crusticola]|uniref:Inner membrane protein YccF n=2 Tax=Aerophototrophica crusticola TaxID=1709002 RepID=A0A858RAY2_9PROT|nr:YccF domain-containing protein [Rhodospirillaceae bacterium B3]
MRMLALLLNLLWLFLFGWAAALGWLLAAVVMVITIVGIPWARSALTIALFTLWPVGRTAVDRTLLTGREDIGTGPLGTVGNIIWFVLAGWWLALLHLVVGIGFCLTIIGIPFGFQHFKFAGLSLAPIGKEIVDKDIAEDLRRRAYG